MIFKIPLGFKPLLKSHHIVVVVAVVVVVVIVVVVAVVVDYDCIICYIATSTVSSSTIG